MSVKSYLKTNNKYESKQYNTIENLSYQKRTSSYSYTMNYDDILEELGELGPWQILNLLLLWLPSVAGGMWVLTYSFAGNTQCFKCPKKCNLRMTHYLLQRLKCQNS